MRPMMIAAMATALAGPAAADPAWRFQLTPYAWGPSVDGNVELQQGSLHFDRSIDTLFDNLNAAAFVNGTARRGRLLLLADLTYSDVSETHDLTPRIAPNVRVVPVSADFRLRTTAATLAAGYTILDRPGAAVDLLAGVRIFRLAADVDVSSPLAALTVTRSLSETWTAPVIGVRGRYAFTPAWSVIGYADYGGFGVKDGTTWQATATVNYAIDARWTISGGYRVLDFAQDRNDRDFDVRLGGPLLGVTFQF